MLGPLKGFLDGLLGLFRKAPPPPQPPPPKEFTSFTPPFVRRVHQGLIAQDLMKVQPIIVSSSSVFFLNLPPRCEMEEHPGFGGLVSDCTDPECVARHIHES